MKRKNYISVIGILTLAFLLNGCAHVLRWQGDRHYNNMSYAESVRLYEKSLARRYHALAAERLAESYLRMNNVDEALKAYERIIAYGEYSPQDMLNYSLVLIQHKDYDLARNWLQQYLYQIPGDAYAQNMLKSCDSVPVYESDTLYYQVSEIPVGKGANESAFAPVFYRDGLILPFEKEKRFMGKAETWTGNAYLDLYYISQDEDENWNAPSKLEGPANGPFHEGPATFNNTGDVMYFTRSNYRNGRTGKDMNGVNNLKIYRSELHDGKWKHITELPFCSDDYSAGHPALSPDEKVLYFASDMPGGYGGTDLYKSERTESGWSKPENLGPAVNTAGNELFPFVDRKGTLYFASNGHPGMGGLDIFYTNHHSPTWDTPVNMRHPINSNRDDFGFIINPESRKGYFSSNRNSNKGIDDLFGFVQYDPAFILKGIVLNKVTGEPLNQALVLVSTEGDIYREFTTGTDGKFECSLMPETAYQIMASKNGFFKNSDFVSTVGEKKNKEYYVELVLDSLILEKPIVLENIYYDFDKWEIREDAKPALNYLVKVMQDNPNIVVELSSHTDSRGTDEYNQKLSQKRAQSAVDYIIEMGIDPGRITAKGYGESKLINACSNGVECTDEEHQMNRRTEFKVVKINEMVFRMAD